MFEALCIAPAAGIEHPAAMRLMMRLRMLAIMLLLAARCPAAQLTLPAQEAFENYAAALEKRLAQQHASPDTYLAVFNLAGTEQVDAERQLMSDPCFELCWSFGFYVCLAFLCVYNKPGISRNIRYNQRREFASVSRNIICLTISGTQFYVFKIGTLKY